MADEIADAILENAQGPRKATGDLGSMEQHSLPDQIAADKHVANQAAAAAPHLRLRIVKLVPPGTV